MSGYKEFEGKTLDDAIRDACSFYDTTREKLEVEILNDAKGGIFGLVGAKKARIRARKVQQIASVLDGLASDSGFGGKNRKPRPEQNGNAGKDARKPRAQHDEDDAVAAQPRERKPQREHARNDHAKNDQPRNEQGRNEHRSEPRTDQPRRERPRDARMHGSANGSVREAALDKVEERDAAAQGERNGRSRRGRDGRDQKNRPNRERSVDLSVSASDTLPQDNDMADMEQENLRRVAIDQLDATELQAAVLEVVTRLTAPILGEANIEIALAEDRVRVIITGVEDPGLLIGRDGQTLAALQYLATRMVSARMKALLRVQIDAGDYRERQDERLRELAFSLAEKVKAGGRPQVTRPLSSYHRRVVHLALQDDPMIQTHSKGDGEMKRVMIARRKAEKSA